MKKKLMMIIAVTIIGCFLLTSCNKEVKTDTISAKLENASEFTTQKLIYNGLIDVKDGKIPIITQNSFIMTYKAVVRAGCNMDDFKVEETEKKVKITIPKMEIQEVNIDPDNLKFYDTTFTILKPDGKDAAKDAMIAAKKDVKEKAKDSGILEAAAENAETIITGIVEPNLDGRELEIVHK